MKENCNRFDGKHVVVTGGGSGIGRGVAIRFAKESANVVIANRNRAKGETVEKEITGLGLSAKYIPADVSDVESINKMIEKAVEIFGPIHVAVSNAGISETQSSALEITPEEWDRVYSVNSKGSFFFCRACAQNMMDNGIQGSIVTLSSIVARSAKNMTGAYASSKASIIMFTRTLAKCLSPMGIRVNCVSPGVVATDIYTLVENEMEMDQGSFADWLIEQSIESGNLLIPRKGEVEDIASAVAFLASDEASYITAQNLCVDGGIDWCW